MGGTSIGEYSEWTTVKDRPGVWKSAGSELNIETGEAEHG